MNFLCRQPDSGERHPSKQLRAPLLSMSVLVTGATGQIGVDLVPALQKIHGESNVRCFLLNTFQANLRTLLHFFPFCISLIPQPFLLSQVVACGHSKVLPGYTGPFERLDVKDKVIPRPAKEHVLILFRGKSQP
jgi:hypothetical protein